MSFAAGMPIDEHRRAVNSLTRGSRERSAVALTNPPCRCGVHVRSSWVQWRNVLQEGALVGSLRKYSAVKWVEPTLQRTAPRVAGKAQLAERLITITDNMSRIEQDRAQPVA